MLRTGAINWSGKNVVRKLQYGTFSRRYLRRHHGAAAGREWDTLIMGKMSPLRRSVLLKTTLTRKIKPQKVFLLPRCEGQSVDSSAPLATNDSDDDISDDENPGVRCEEVFSRWDSSQTRKTYRCGEVDGFAFPFRKNFSNNISV